MGFAGPGDSHELPDQVPGDELDGLRLAARARGSEGFLSGRLVLEQHGGAAAAGQGLWGSKDSVGAGPPASPPVSPDLKCSLPRSWGFRPLAGRAVWGPGRRAIESSQGPEKTAWLSALALGQTCAALTGSSENKAPLHLADGREGCLPPT